MLTLAVVLMVVLGLVVGLVGLVLWTRYRLALEAAVRANALIDANRALPRPGMATPDPRFRVIRRRAVGQDEGRCR